MQTVSYQYQFEYKYDAQGRLFPQLKFHVSTPAQPQETYQAGAGSLISATVHTVRLAHDDLGVFDIEVGLSSTEVLGTCWAGTSLISSRLVSGNIIACST